MFFDLSVTVVVRDLWPKNCYHTALTFIVHAFLCEIAMPCKNNILAL